jgi:hypothetical protein
MIDLFSLAVSHGLMMLAAWRLLARDDLDRDPGEAAPGAPAARKRF